MVKSSLIAFSKRYNSSQSEIECQIYTISIESFLRVTSSSIHAVNLPTSSLILEFSKNNIFEYVFLLNNLVLEYSSY